MRRARSTFRVALSRAEPRIKLHDGEHGSTNVICTSTTITRRATDAVCL